MLPKLCYLEWYLLKVIKTRGAPSRGSKAQELNNKPHGKSICLESRHSQYPVRKFFCESGRTDIRVGTTKVGIPMYLDISLRISWKRNMCSGGQTKRILSNISPEVPLTLLRRYKTARNCSAFYKRNVSYFPRFIYANRALLNISIRNTTWSRVAQG